MDLFIHQEKAIEKLRNLRAGALFMDMGTGKTRTAIEIVMDKSADFDTIIWIAPASLINSENYIDEIHKWYKGGKGDIVFFTLEGISQSDTAYLKLRDVAERSRNFCVIDESLGIKNSEAKRTKRLLQMWDMFDFRLILNGTPISKGLIDIYSQLQFIHPNILKMTEAQFANNFLQYRRDGHRPWMRWSKPENEKALIEIMRPYIFDADLDMDINYITISKNVRLSNSEASDYADFKREWLKDKINVGFLAVCQKFQHYYTLCQAKIEWLTLTISKIRQSGDSAIIFVKFMHEIDFLIGNFVGIEYSGRTKGDLSTIGKGNDLVFMTYGTGSKGLNLQAANHVIFLSQTFDMAHKAHGLARVYRSGQNKQVTVYNCFIDTGLDKLMQASLDKKYNVSQNIGNLISNKEALKL